MAMRKVFYGLLILTVVCIIAAANSPKYEIVKNNIVFSNYAEPEKPVLMAETVMETKASTSLTDNGLEIKIGRIRNDGNETIEQMILLPVDGRKYYFNITIYPKTVWTYANIDGITIVPQSSARISYETSFYSNGGQLRVVMDQENLKKMWIFTEEKGRPGFILADSDILWGYDAETKIITVESDKFNHKVLVYWVNYRTSGTVFIEDTRNVEILEYRFQKLQDDKEIKTIEISEKTNYTLGLEVKIENLSSASSALVFQRGNLTLEIDRENQTLDEFNSRITGNVVVSPSTYIIYIIVLIILVIILVEALFFGNKKEDVIKEISEEDAKYTVGYNVKGKKRGKNEE